MVGQRAIAQTLKNAIKTNKVAHAYLFAGTRGVGKTTMARILAKALNCLKYGEPTAEPCCECSSCVAVHAGDDIDVIEVDGASNRGIEHIRELRQNAIYRPARARYKIYIIDEVHMLTTEAFNALLKILEEPPGHVKFIFATTQPNKVIATIQSRCQRFDFGNISAAEIAAQLKRVLNEEKIKFEDDLMVHLGRLASGSMRDGLSLLDQLISTGEEPLTVSLLEEYLGVPDREKLYNLIAKIGDSEAAKVLGEIDGLLDVGQTAVQIVDALIEYMRDLMIIKTAGFGSELLILTEDERQAAGQLADKFDAAGLIYNITALEKLRWTIKNSERPRAFLEAAMLRLALSEHFLNVDEILSQLKNNPAGTIKKKTAGPLEIKSRRDSNDEGAVRQEKSRSGAESAEQDKIDLHWIKKHWQETLGKIASGGGKNLAGLLVSAVPSQFQDGLLTVSFPPGAAMAMQLCQANGRSEQIESFLSDVFGVPVKVKFIVSADGQSGRGSEKNRPRGAKLSKKKIDEIISDPAVKTLLTELDAKVTDVEESQ